ncbi:MAG: hypothetical protein WCK64_08825 [Synechococcaceae cyanobacterium ELA445]
MLFPAPPSPLTALSLVGLKATVLLLLTLLIKSRIQIKFFSALGIVLLVLQTLAFLAAGGLVAGGVVATAVAGRLRRP